MLRNEEFIMKKKYFCVRNDNYIYHYYKDK